MDITKQTIREALQGYMECALWSSTDDTTDQPLDDEYGTSDIAKDTRRRMLSELIDFMRGVREHLTAYPDNASQFGHDFWLTRNGHGAGFWDRGHGKLGDTLSDAARVYGSVYLYASGDDTPQVHQM